MEPQFGARLGPVVVWMVFPRLDPGSTVLVDPGKTLYRKEAGKKAGCSDGKGRRYEKCGIMAIVEGEAHSGLGLRGGLLAVWRFSDRSPYTRLSVSSYMETLLLLDHDSNTAKYRD
ncbi:hypothetical protein Tco_0010172 [Tanacetum coccineum]